jgi:hypothetical protein
MHWKKIYNNWNKPVGDRDYEVLGMDSFGEYTQLYGYKVGLPPVTRAKHWPFKKSIEEKKGVNIEK